ncbi:enhanced intracellular survival protein Eis [Streptomyces phaeochromogenes]|uniref:GNAT family N-acetyltransferase n=1 Tax=Streptomyces phaeochromogenes TaxID=1923 RepID=UPI0033C47F1A
MPAQLSLGPADDDMWQQYDHLATRSFGHPLADIASLRPHADLRVATRNGTVVAGGLGLLIPQYFGGSPLPSACLGAGCVAPEERGEHLAATLMSERLRALQDQGAVTASIWTAANGYARHLGFEAPMTTMAWSVTPDDLKRSFTADDYDVAFGLTPAAVRLQQDLAHRWHGPLQRPHWWPHWSIRRHSLSVYRFSRPGRPPTGVLGFAMTQSEQHDIHLAVHDFWTADQDTASAMLAFLGRQHRAALVEFRRNALPPSPLLLHNLHRYRPSARAWHPWMLRILSIPKAVQLRGWPPHLDLSIPIEVTDSSAGTTHTYLLHIQAGSAEIRPTSRAAQVSFTGRQFAVWFAGGYRSATTAHLSGVRCTSPQALDAIIRSTTDREPWLPDQF